ncbi:MAG: glycosyltransferase family 4 protein [Caulobacteraceae bacterium]|nr:glycosyltransferase family 4 protein [Caulobacteraceae bacterium]
MSATACIDAAAPVADAGAAADGPQIVLDLSRLLSRVLHPTPTGVDRVEMAYAEGLLRLAPERLQFTAFHPCGLHGRLPTGLVSEFLALTAARWTDEGWTEPRTQRWRRAAAACLSLAPRPISPSRAATGRPRAYLHLSARGLERHRAIAAILTRRNARFIPFVHDLIPLEHPEYARPGGARDYARKIAAASALASGVLVNSQATAEALAPALTAAGRATPVRVAPLGVPTSPPIRNANVLCARPYFVALGTIEPRKNHLLLLHLWRRMALTLGPERTPDLMLVGRRGWESEMVFDLLDRAPTLRGVVHELGCIPDTRLRELIRGARAVLLPSFAEGYGLPVAEALALGAPVIASDLPALRETGGGAPDYLDPLDGAAWAAAAADYATPGSARRQAQLARIARWRPPTWDDHLAAALDFIDEVCA